MVQTAETITEPIPHPDMNDPEEHVSSVTSLRDIMAQEEKSKKKQPAPKNQTKYVKSRGSDVYLRNVYNCELTIIMVMGLSCRLIDSIILIYLSDWFPL